MERVASITPSTRPIVLFVDGHDDTRDLYAVALALHGFETVGAADGALAFARACDASPDIVVTDVSLPGTDGWTFVRVLKRDPRTRGTPVVVLTAYAPEWVRERAEREGCAAVLVKPYLPEQLAAELRALLARHSSAHASLRG